MEQLVGGLVPQVAPPPAATYAATSASAPVTEYVTPTPADLHAAPARVIDHVALAPGVSHAAPAPVIEDEKPASAVICATPVPVIEHVVPAPVTEHFAPASPVTISSPSQRLPPAYTSDPPQRWGILRKIAAHQITASDLSTFTITFLINLRMKFVMTTT